MTSGIALRLDETPDWPAIFAIYDAAFGQSAEAELVRRLDADGDLLLSLTACRGEPAGHIAYSALALGEAPAVKACALAPLAVAPSFQRQGVGSALVREGLDRMRKAGFDLAVVLGDPDYYRRFGFRAEAARRLKTPYDGPYLQALALTERGRDARGPVAYARAFAELS